MPVAPKQSLSPEEFQRAVAEGRVRIFDGTRWHPVGREHKHCTGCGAPRVHTGPCGYCKTP